MNGSTLRCGDFEIDTAAYELRFKGDRIKIERIPMDLLLMLVERRGQVVSREEIIERLWGKDIFVDTENNINAAIRKIRQALNDTPDRPVFIRTITGKGYSFIAPVTSDGAVHQADGPPIQNVMPETSTSLASNSPFRFARTLAYTALLMFIALSIYALKTISYESDTISKRLVLAILPFEDLSGEKEQEYFSDGLTEETISAVGGMNAEQLSVIARTSSMLYKKTGKTVAQIGQELGADYLLESSVRREEDRVRVVSKLIRVKDQSQIWAQSYDRAGPSAIEIQDELGRAIAREITGILPDRTARSTRRLPTAEVYDLYLHGRYDWSRRTPQDVREAIEYFKLAISKDPQYAPALASLAIAYTSLTLNNDEAPMDAWRKARSAADDAIRLDPDLAEAQAADGFISLNLEWDWTRAEKSFRRAAQRNPNWEFPHVMLAHVFTRTGRASEAAEQMARAQQVDPLSAAVHALTGQILNESRHYREAAEAAKKALNLSPDFWIGHVVLGAAYERQGNYAEALREFDQAYASSHNSKALAYKGYVLAKTGRRDEAEDVIRTMKEMAHERFLPPLCDRSGLRRFRRSRGGMGMA